MSRSAADATRFTATAPHAYSKPASFRSTAPNTKQPPRNAAIPPRPGVPTGGPPGETPAEKVARLRAAHAAKRAAEITTWDRVVIRGRAIADTAHRITVMGLVGLSVVAGAVTIYSFIDLSIYNRRKKREWLENQYSNLQQQLIEARRAELEGTATDDQILILNRERAANEAEQARATRPGILGSIKGVFTTTGYNTEEKVDDSKLAGISNSAAASVPVIAVPDPTVPFAAPPVGSEAQKDAERGYAEGVVTKAIKEQKRQGERATELQRVAGGMLDQMAARAADKTKESAGVWSSWFGSGSGSGSK